MARAQDLTVMDQAVFKVRKSLGLQPSFNFLVEDKSALEPSELKVSVVPRETLVVPIQTIQSEYDLHQWFRTDPGYIGSSLPTPIEAFASKQRYGVLILTGEASAKIRDRIFTELSSLIRFGKFVEGDPQHDLTKLSTLIKISTSDYLTPQVSGRDLIANALVVDRVGPYAFLSYTRRQLGDLIYSGCSPLLDP